MPSPCNCNFFCNIKTVTPSWISILSCNQAEFSHLIGPCIPCNRKSLSLAARSSRKMSSSHPEGPPPSLRPWAHTGWLRFYKQCSRKTYQVKHRLMTLFVQHSSIKLQEIRQPILLLAQGIVMPHNRKMCMLKWGSRWVLCLLFNEASIAHSKSLSSSTVCVRVVCAAVPTKSLLRSVFRIRIRYSIGWIKQGSTASSSIGQWWDIAFSHTDVVQAIHFLWMKDEAWWRHFQYYQQYLLAPQLV